MILHILRFRFQPGTTEEQIAGVVASMHRFAEIPVVDQLLVGQDIAADGYYSHAMIVAVSDVEACASTTSIRSTPPPTGRACR